MRIIKLVETIKSIIMKNTVLSILALGFILTLNACNANKTTQATETSNEVWAEGITTITGIISNVIQEKDGQTIMLTNNKGIEYTAVVSTANLGDNAAQYREFKVGESIGFRGNLIENQRMVVREVLESK